MNRKNLLGIQNEVLNHEKEKTKNTSLSCPAFPLNTLNPTPASFLCLHVPICLSRENIHFVNFSRSKAFPRRNETR